MESTATRPVRQALREVKGLRVLVVEDHAEIARLFSTLLRHHGCDVATAGNGNAAVMLAESFRPEVVLLDIRLPDIDGFEVARRVVKKGLPRPLIIAVTAYSQDRYGQQASECGIDVFLRKPVSASDLLREIMAAQQDQ